jgi:hypothetical protein
MYDAECRDGRSARREMKLRHTAAVALAGWILAEPPPFAIGIPMANWSDAVWFDTKAGLPTWILSRMYWSELSGTAPGSDRFALAYGERDSL